MSPRGSDDRTLRVGRRTVEGGGTAASVCFRRWAAGSAWHDTWAVLNGVLRVLGTRAQWRELPEKYPPYQTCLACLQMMLRHS